MDGFFTPPDHIQFEAKKLFGPLEGVMDGSVAYLQPGGGGPLEKHTHSHNHLFFVISGQANVLLGDDEIVIPQGGSYLVTGTVPHSVWNGCGEVTVMLGISLKPGSEPLL